MTGLLFIFILVLLIIVHELGHFTVAKLFKIRVDEFGIFFPPRLFGKKFGETLYTINWLPFGGFVKIFGENTDEKDPTLLSDPKSFVHKPRYIQAAVIVAGIVCNILFAWVALSASYMLGMQASAQHTGVGKVENAQTTILNVVPGSPAAKAGILPHDILRVIQTGTDKLPEDADAKAVLSFIRAHADESMILTVRRGDTPFNFLAKPAEGIVEGQKALGIELDDIGTLKLNPVLALVQGAVATKQMTVLTAQGLVSFFSTMARGTADFSSVAGPIGIVKIGSNAVADGVLQTLLLTALISINLAIINLLPIPGLDGGRLLFIVVESVIRRPLSEKFSTRFTIVGFALLATLMLVISYHDIVRLFG